MWGYVRGWARGLRLRLGERRQLLRRHCARRALVGGALMAIILQTQDRRAPLPSPPHPPAGSTRARVVQLSGDYG